MRLQRLIVHGFKSFADRTEITFEGGALTCIVGPNGCGKSNVIDAVKWILGEQRPTSLRGREMMDVIFNGTVRRAPMGLCEGTLVFANEDRVLPEDADEVSITRRVFRTGETEYQINGRPSRLKDVRDLFAGTGLGAGGYAFMEQGKIDAVLANNAVDRRRVFEEAAGISRLRARRHETELKLQKVDENLSRLADVVEEISRQVRSLKLQAGKARSHRELTLKLQELQNRAAFERWRVLSQGQIQLAAELSGLFSERDNMRTARDESKLKASGIEAELTATVDHVAGARSQHAELSARIGSLKDTITLQRRYVEEGARRLENRRTEAEEACRSATELAEEETLVRRESEAIARDVQGTARELTEATELVREARNEASAAAATRTQTEAQLAAHDRELAGADREQARAETALAHGRTNLAAAEERLQRSESALARLKTELTGLAGAQGERTEALECSRNSLTAAELEVERCEGAVNEAQEVLRRTEAEQHRAQARKDVLTSTLRRGEGLNEGTLAIMAEKARRPDFMPGFRGLLLHLFEVDFAEARGIEAALGDAAQALVVANGKEAVEGLRFLREKHLGGAIFLPLDRFEDAGSALPAGVRANAADIGRVLSSLLAGVRVLGREEFEQELSAGTSSAAMLVSADGDVLRSGRMLATPRGGPAAQGLVTLQAEARRLERRLQGLGEERDAAKSKLGALIATRDEARGRVKDLSVQLVKAEGEAARVDQQAVRLVNEMERLSGERNLLLRELAVGREGLENSATELESVRALAATLSEQRVQREATVEAARQRQSAVQLEVDRLQQRLHEVRLADAKLHEKLDAARARVVFLGAGIRDAEQRSVSAREEEARLVSAIAEAEAALERDAAQLRECENNIVEAARRLQVVEGGADVVRERMRAAAAALEGADAALTAIMERIAEARAAEAGNDAAVEALKAHVRDDLGLDLESFERMAQEPTPVVEPEADGAPALSMEEAVKDLKERIARLGNVNLAAVEELEAAEQRNSFIVGERDDLLKAKEQLQKVAKSIEEQSTTLFLETFNAVREHFSVVYRRLFGGGRAEISLENVDLPLECGIEIKAQPPGKELQSITLLSGGERSLTAVALLFAIFRAHPAPCAFLDEVDAALDEENTERFVRLVAEWRQKSQFVVVTHSKRTMEHADRLFGVTMPERGVSRRVSVRIEQVDADGRIKEDESLPQVPPLATPRAARRVRPSKNSDDVSATTEELAAEDPQQN
jgi:chromosome segregation protein